MTDPRKHQRKLEKKRAKRKEKRHLVVREHRQGVRERLESAARCPVLHCIISESFWEAGIGQLLLSRSLPDGSVAAAVFLVDRYCLGIKDAFARIVSRFEYESDFYRNIYKMGVRSISPAIARKLVDQAVEYAHGLGFPPHPDYRKARPIFGDIDAGTSSEEFEFGYNGKPFFVAGPNDNRQRCRAILSTLENNCGPGGYDFLLPVDFEHELVEDVDDGDDDEE